VGAQGCDGPPCIFRCPSLPGLDAAAGARKVFVGFHNPAFARSGMGAIPEAQNPHKILASYAKDLNIVVFNGHVHATETCEVEGVKYLLLGGGGAEQDPILPGRTNIKVPADYPPDLYWKGQPPREEYNYVLVDVEPGQKTRFTLNRFRGPQSHLKASLDASLPVSGRSCFAGSGSSA
jgi:hypothetical protein